MAELRVFNGANTDKLELLEYLYRLKHLVTRHQTHSMPGWMHDITGGFERAMDEGNSPGDIIKALREYGNGHFQASEGAGTDSL